MKKDKSNLDSSMTRLVVQASDSIFSLYGFFTSMEFVTSWSPTYSRRTTDVVVLFCDSTWFPQEV